jgi:predicted N-acetyltransferase YhbS
VSEDSMTEISIGTASEDDWDAIYPAMSLAFNEDGDEQSARAERGVFEPARVLVARRRGEVVGTAGILTRELAVPGATVPTAHVTMVTVAATARRQGVLTRFMKQQFADMRTAGEPIAALWASEGRIYQRFGYGLAARRLSLSIDTREVRLNEPAAGPGLRPAAASELPKVLADIYGQVYPQRPGWSERHDNSWEYKLSDPPGRRNGATRLQITLSTGTRCGGSSPTGTVTGRAARFGCMRSSRSTTLRTGRCGVFCSPSTSRARRRRG